MRDQSTLKSRFHFATRTATISIDCIAVVTPFADDHAVPADRAAAGSVALRQWLAEFATQVRVGAVITAFTPTHVAVPARSGRAVAAVGIAVVPVYRAVRFTSVASHVVAVVTLFLSNHQAVATHAQARLTQGAHPPIEHFARYAAARCARRLALFWSSYRTVSAYTDKCTAFTGRRALVVGLRLTTRIATIA
jgi:hypothetical protein